MISHKYAYVSSLLIAPSHLPLHSTPLGSNRVPDFSCLSEWLSTKDLQIINAGEGMEKREHPCIVGGNAITDSFKIGKKVCQICILFSAYLTYMQNTSCKMLDWMNHKLESALPGEI